MDFEPSETQQMLSNAVERLLADTYDLQARLLKPDAQADADLWTALADMGLMGVEVEEAHGGIGGTFEDMAAALKPIGAALVTAPVVSTGVLAAGLLKEASAGQKAEWLGPLAAGGLRASVAHSETRARDTLSWVETTAVRTAEGWVLNGAKAVVLGGDSADLFLVSARTSGGPNDIAGLSLFAVPRGAAGLGVDGYRLYEGSGAADLVLTDVSLPADALIGAQDGAFEPISLAWDRGVAAVCVEAIGVMDALRDLTLDYLRTREQFGKPIGQFQALQHRMADAYMAIELARSMSLLAVSAIGDSDSAARAASISAAKVAIGDACREVGQTCVQLHGGIALTEEYPAGHYFKRLTMIERLFGDPDFHLRRYAGLG